ncbi:MAG: Ig-like domain-containing protein, partial [Syntrophomonas sp.]
MTIKLKNPIILVFLVLTMILVMTTAGEAKPVSLSHKNQTDNNILIYEDQQKTESTAGKQKLMTSGDEEDPFPDPERDNTKRELNSPGTKEQVAKAIKGNSADTGRLIAVTPEDGSCEVDPLAEVSATFCVTLDNNTVNKNNVILESLSLGEIISDYSVIYSEYNNKIKILPYSALCNSTSYRITLKSALRDTKGRSVVDSDYSWTFTTKGDPSASIFDDYRNCRVMAGCGERLAWLQYTSRDGYRIYAADLITGKAKNISLLKDGIASDDVQLAIYEQGAVWAIKNSDGWELTYYDPEKAQEASIAEGLPEAPCPDIWGENIVYVDCSQGEGDIWLYNTGDGTRQAVCSAPGEQSQPRISQNYIVWEDNRNGNSDIYAYDLSQKTEKEVITSNTAQTDPDIWENTVVWHDDYINGCGIYYADLSGDISPQKLIYDVQSNRVSPRIYGNKVSWQVGEYFGSTVYDGIFLSEIGSDEINAPYVGGKSKGQYFINDDYGIMLNNQLHEIYSFRLIPSNTDPLETRYVFPKPNSRGFRVESPVAVSFSRALDAATVNRDSFFLSRTDGTRVEAEITSDSASGLYLLRPVDHLAEGTVYTINLTSAICDLEGQALAPCSWSFTTAAHDALPLTIETNVISSYPTVFDSNLLFLANRQQLYRYDADFGGSALLYESPLLELGLKDWGLDYPPHCYGDNVVISSYNPDNLSYDMLVLDAATGEQKGKTKAPTEEVYPYTYGPWAAWLEMEGTDNLNKPGKLKIVDLNSGGSVEIAEKVYPYWFPCIAGNLVCWAGKETGRYQLHIKDLSKNSLWVDDTNNPQAYPFIWKDRIVWIEVTGQGFEIWYGQIGPEGIEERQAVVSSPGCECSRPFIYGNNIVWNEKQDGKWQIYCYNLAAGERKLLVDQENPALWGVFGNQVVWTQYDQAYQTIFEDPSPDVRPPAIPANLECYINDGDLEINWDRSPDDIEVVGYRLERSEDGINWSSLGVWYDYDINEERVGCQDIAPAQNCFYRISAYDAAGNCSEWTLPCQVQGENIPQLAVVSGNNQSQAPGKSLTEPLVLCLKDSFGQALSGVKVNLATVSGQAGFDPLDRITDENGQVQFKITVQGTGKIRLIAGCPELNGVEASIILYGIDASYSLTTVSGQDQSGLMGEILPQPFTVLLNDAGGQPIADCDVSFKVKSGTAKLLVSGSEQNASQEVTVITAADGTASVRVIPGFGENIINVSVTGLLQEAEFSCLGGSEALIAGSISNYTELYANHGYWDLEVYTTDELGNQGPVVTVDDHGKFSIPITGGVWTLGLKSVDEGQGMPIAFPAPCQVLVDTGETPVSLALIPAPVRVRGRVTDEEGHPFLSDWGYPMRVEVWASSLNHPLGPIVSSRKRTDDEGNFEFYLPTGSFTLGCWVQGYILPPDNRIEVTEQGPTEDIWIKIPRGKCDISGYTYNLNNKLSGVMVTAWSAEHG